MAEDLAPPSARRSDIWIWALVVLATGSVVALAVMQGNRPAPPSGTAAPALTLPLLGGGQAPLPRDRITMIDFWATWCAPCRTSMPRVQRLWAEYRQRGVDLYSIDTDEPAPDRDAQVREFLQENRLTFPVVLDDGSASRAFAVENLPTMMLLDGGGRVVWKHIGTLTAPHEQELRAAIDRALGR